MPKMMMKHEKFVVDKKTGKSRKVGKTRISTMKKISEEDFFGDMKTKSKKLSVDMRKKKRIVGKRGKKLGLK